MAKQSRGSNRVPNRPANPGSSSPSPSASSNRPAGQRPAGQRPAGQRQSGQRSSEPWRPNRVSASNSSSGPSRTALMTIGGIIVGVLIVAYVAFQQLGSGSGPATNNDAIIAPGAANSTPASIHTDGKTLGNPQAPVTIDLYGDFRCSACYSFTEAGTAAQMNTQLVATGKAKVVWHDFTIIDGNSGEHASRDAANAAWCAADQNKFWVMHDYLYANQTSEAASVFTMDRLLKIGQMAGLDMATYTPCLQNGTHNADIAKEESSLPASVTGHGTPTVLVNGTFVNATFADIKAAVDAATANPSGSPAASPASAAPSGS